MIIQVIRWNDLKRGNNMTKKFNSIERCDCNVIHEDIVNQVRDKMPQEESLYDLKYLEIQHESGYYGLYMKLKCVFVISLYYLTWHNQQFPISWES